MKDKRRLIILLLFIFAAFMTPGQDPVSMMVLALSLTVLMEVAIQFTRINDRRRDKQRPDWLDLDDDQSSGPIAASGGIGQLGGIALEPRRRVSLSRFGEIGARLMKRLVVHTHSPHALQSARRAW